MLASKIMDADKTTENYYEQFPTVCWCKEINNNYFSEIISWTTIFTSQRERKTTCILLLKSLFFCIMVCELQNKVFKKAIFNSSSATFLTIHLEME